MYRSRNSMGSRFQSVQKCVPPPVIAAHDRRAPLRTPTLSLFEYRKGCIQTLHGECGRFSCWSHGLRTDYSISVTEVMSVSDTAWQLIAASSGLRRALRRRLGADDVSGLSDAQRELVRTVGRHPGIRVGEAALELHLAANTVSTLVSSLAAAGWILRQTDPLDARSARLSLTAGAERRIEEWRDRRLAIATGAMRSLDAEDQRRIAAALPALERLVQQVESA